VGLICRLEWSVIFMSVIFSQPFSASKTAHVVPATACNTTFFPSSSYKPPTTLFVTLGYTLHGLRKLRR